MVEKKPSIFEKIKKQFNTTIPDDYDLEFDFCMKCGRRLPDKKASSLRRHQKAMHKLPKKKKLKEFLYKHILVSLILIMLIGVGVLHLIAPVVDFVFDYLIPEKARRLTDAQADLCLEDTLELKYKLQETGSFTIEHSDEFNRLMNECNVDFFIQTRTPPVFEDQDYIRPEP